MKSTMVVSLFIKWQLFEAIMNNTRTVTEYYSSSSYFSNFLRKNGFNVDLTGHTFTENGYLRPYIYYDGLYSHNSERYLVHSTVRKMLTVLFPHFIPTEIEQFYSFLKFGFKVIAETDIEDSKLYAFSISSYENKVFTVRSDFFSFHVQTGFSLTSLGISLTPVTIAELSYEDLMSANIEAFKLSLLTLIGEPNTMINDNTIRNFIKETRIEHHLRKYGNHVKYMPFNTFVNHSLDFFLKDIEYSKKIGFGISSRFGYIHSEYMEDLKTKDKIQDSDHVSMLFNAKDFRSIKPLLKNVMNEKDMEFMFCMFDMYLFKMNLQNNPNSHNLACFTKEHIEKIPKSKTLENKFEHFEFKYNDFIFQISGSLLFTDFSGKGGYYSSKENDFEKMYIDYQKHTVKAISAILKEPAEDINCNTLLLHFMSII